MFFVLLLRFDKQQFIIIEFKKKETYVLKS